MRRTWTLIVAAALLTTACAGRAPHRSAGSVASPSAAAGSPGTRSTPSAVTSPATPHCPEPMGAAVSLRDRASGGSLRLLLAHPSWSSTSLSPDYGSPPRNGWYLTVHVRLVATGDQPITIGPGDFYVSAPGRPRTTTDDGNADESGASQALGTAAADPGETITGPLTFDVSDRHGLVVYAPAARTVCSWRF